MIQLTRVPLCRACKNDVWEFFPLDVGVTRHLEIRKSLYNIQWHDISVIRANTLSASHLDGTVVDLILVVFNLPCRVDGPPYAMVSILMENEDYRASLSDDFCGGIHNLQGIHFVIVNASDIDLTMW